LDDSRLSVGDRRHCHAPLDQAVDRKPLCRDALAFTSSSMKSTRWKQTF
jgi:hypothetical protein